MSDPSSFLPMNFVYNNGSNNLLYDVGEYSNTNSVNYHNPPPMYNNSYLNHHTPNFQLPTDKSYHVNNYSSPSSQMAPSSSPSVWYDPHQQVSYVYSPYPVLWFVKNEENHHAKESEVPRTPPTPCHATSATVSPVPSPVQLPSGEKKEESCILLREVLTDELLKLPQATVAEKLGINSSSFSKKWKREFPGKSWPHRKHKKIDIQLQMLYNRLPYVTSDKEREEIEHLKVTLEEKMRRNLRRPYDDKEDGKDSKAEKQKKSRSPSATPSPSAHKAAQQQQQQQLPQQQPPQQRAPKRRRVDAQPYTGACLDPTL